MPTTPQILFRSTRIASGTVTLGVGSSGFDPVTASYAWYEVARILPDDANFDRSLSQVDIDLLAAAIREGTDTKRFDMNQDRLVNAEDHVAWVHDLKSTWYGDADLNGQFNSDDMVAVFVAGKYETEGEASWAEGDWDGSGFFNADDMVTAFIDGGYERGQYAPAAAAVPEPGALPSLLIALLALSSLPTARTSLNNGGRHVVARAGPAVDVADSCSANPLPADLCRLQALTADCPQNKKNRWRSSSTVWR